ncbi:hypothetical protein L7F22_040887 [Adiantum nelumboides]|nr:hypothetical protein [Adiantum nelumboides]
MIDANIAKHPSPSHPRRTGAELMATSPQTVELKVAMSCQGCVGAVKRVLGKMEGVEKYDIDLDAQKVTVKGNVKPEDVLATVCKTGKATSFWPSEGSTAA